MSDARPIRRGDLVPPLLTRWYVRRVRGAGYYGDYPSWAAARRDSRGYDAGVILEKVKAATLAVRDGRAAYERDSVLFDAVQHSFPLLAGLLRFAKCGAADDPARRRLSVLDFGGSLGSSYFQCRGFLAPVELRWSVVEQPGFVACGREHLQTEALRFYPDADACLREERPDVLLLSSVLPYLERPHAALADLLARGLPGVIVDRTPVLREPCARGSDRLTVQRVPPEVYGAPASYPAWVLRRDALLAVFAERYELLAAFDALAGPIDLGDAVAHDEGFIFARRDTGPPANAGGGA